MLTAHRGWTQGPEQAAGRRGEYEVAAARPAGRAVRPGQQWSGRRILLDGLAGWQAAETKLEELEADRMRKEQRKTDEISKMAEKTRARQESNKARKATPAQPKIRPAPPSSCPIEFDVAIGLLSAAERSGASPRQING